MAAALCYGSLGGGAQLAFHHHLGAHDTQTLIGALGELSRTLGGEKVTLLWDGLPSHRSRVMHAWLRCQRSWLVLEPLPGYAPEPNPVEALWSNLKGVELANLAGDTLEAVTAAAERGVQRIRHTHHLAYSFPTALQAVAVVSECWECSWAWGRRLALGRARAPTASPRAPSEGGEVVAWSSVVPPTTAGSRRSRLTP
jgi:putative transposase